MAISISQFVSATFTASSSGNVLFSSAVSSGNLIVAHVAQFNNGGGTFTNILDNKNAGNYTIGINSTHTGNTNTHLILGYKTNISSGALASTYRVSVNLAGSNLWSVGACEYSGGPFTTGSTASANGTSSSPAPGATTASSTPGLWVTAACHDSTATFNSTVVTGTWLATVDPTNGNQILVFGHSTNSSLTQNPTFGMGTSTAWLADSMIFLGLGGGAAAAVIQAWSFNLTGLQ